MSITSVRSIISAAVRGFFVFALFGFAMVALPHSASASTTIGSVTFNGGSTASVAASASVTVVVPVTLTSSSRWQSTSYRIGSTGNFTCVDTADRTTSGSNTFSIIAPASAGTYNVEIRTYGGSFTNNTCSGSQTQSKIISNALTVTASLTSQTITVTQSAPASAQNGSSFNVAATASSNLPVAISTTGGCSVSGGTVTMNSDTTACVVHYNQAGNGTYSAAPEKTETTTATAAATACTLDSGNDLIDNPCLETGTTWNGASGGPDNWFFYSAGVTATAAYPSADAHSGTKAASVTVTAVTNPSGEHDAQWGFNPVSVTPDTNYQFSFWYKADVDTEVDAEYDTAGGNIYAQVRSNLPATGGTWKQFTTNIIPPQGTTQMSIVPLITKPGTLTVDDFQLQKIADPNAFSAGMVSLNFDDGLASFWDHATSTLNAAGIKATAYIITGSSGSNVTSVSPNGGYLSKAQIQALYAAGYDIGDHTASHADLTSGVNLTTEINNSVSALSTALGAAVTTIAYPYGAYNTAVETQVQNGSLSIGRSVDDGYNDKATDRYALRIKEIFDTTSVAQVESWIDDANSNHEWLILLMHDVQPTCPANPASPTECITVSDLASIANYLNSSHTSTVTMTQGAAVMAGGSIPPQNHAPTFTSSAVTTASANAAYSYNVTASDQDGDTMAITADTLPAWLSLTDHSDGTATLSGTPGDADATTGTFPITLHVSDGTLSADQSFVIAVGADAAPTLAEVTPVPTPTNNATPSYTFSSSEAGTIAYGGSCTSATTAAVAGNNTVTFASLAEGTYSDCTVTVTDPFSHASVPLAVSAFSIDLTKPVITLVGDASIATTTQTSAYTDAGATASDEPGSTDLTANIVVTGSVNLAVPGSYVLHYNVSDAAGNAADEVTRTVNVSDATAPVIIASDITAEATDANGAAVTYPDPTVTDDVDTGLTAACTPASGSVFPIGVTSVSCTATDSSNNIGTGSFNVTVKDTTAPVLTAPADQTFEATGATTWPDGIVLPAVSDAVDSNPVISHDPTALPIGTSQVTWTATDASGNASASVASNVTVTDTTAPFIDFHGATTTDITVGGAFTDNATAYDAVDGDLTSSLLISGSVDTNTVGTYTIDYGSVTDSHGNTTATSTRTVNVVAAQQQSGGGGGGGCSGCCGSCGGGVVLGLIGQVNTNPTGGQVLGASTGGLTEAQINAILDLLRSFNADQSVIDNVSAALHGQVPAGQTGEKFIFTQTLKVGSTGNEVTELQSRLTLEGVYSGPITGYFGPLTKAAVMKYQATHDIEQVGIVGPQTRAELNR